MKPKFQKISESLDDVRSLLGIEEAGRIASDRGIAESDNPFDPEKNDRECAMWSNGWHQSQTVLLLGQLRSVIRWSVNGLSLIREILVCDGHEDLIEESLGKLDTVIQKLSDNVKGV